MDKCNYCDKSFEENNDYGTPRSYWWVTPSSLCASCMKKYFVARGRFRNWISQKIGEQCDSK